jgi:hypothetical protein
MPIGKVGTRSLHRCFVVVGQQSGLAAGGGAVRRRRHHRIGATAGQQAAEGGRARGGAGWARGSDVLKTKEYVMDSGRCATQTLCFTPSICKICSLFIFSNVNLKRFLLTCTRWFYWHGSCPAKETFRRKSSLDIDKDDYRGRRSGVIRTIYELKNDENS